MALPGLVSDPADLSEFPGAPYPTMVQLAAEEAVRSEAGWHIAPVVTETITVDGSGWHPLLLLPTLKVVSVTAVEVFEDGTWVARTGYTVAESGMLYHADGWRYGIGGVRVTFSHGYEDCPYDLLPVIAAKCQRSTVTASVSQQSETVGSRTSSQSFFNPTQVIGGATVPPRYTLIGRVV